MLILIVAPYLSLRVLRDKPMKDQVPSLSPLDLLQTFLNVLQEALGAVHHNLHSGSFGVHLQKLGLVLPSLIRNHRENVTNPFVNVVVHS